MDIEHRSPKTNDKYKVPVEVGNATNEEEAEAVEGEEEVEVVEGEEEVEPVEGEVEPVEGEEEVEAEEVEGEEEAKADEEKEESVEGGCGQCTAQIWDTAFANPNAVTLSDLFLDTAKDMSTDPVCSDSIRYTYKTVETLMTSPGARYTMAMLFKLLWSASKKLSDNNGLNFKETTKVVNRLLNEQPVQDMFVFAVAGAVQLYQDPVVREQTARLVKVYGSQLKSAIISKLSNLRNTSAAKKRRTSGRPASKRS